MHNAAGVSTYFLSFFAQLHVIAIAIIFTQILVFMLPTSIKVCALDLRAG
jgi:hypothetical protein